MMQVGKEVNISEQQCYITHCALEMSDENAYIWLLLSENEAYDEDMQKPQGLESRVAGLRQDLGTYLHTILRCR